MNIWHWISLLLEVGVAVLGVMLVTGKKKSYGWCIALTFVIYVFYDLARFMALALPPMIMDLGFAIASLSIFWAVLMFYLENK